MADFDKQRAEQSLNYFIEEMSKVYRKLDRELTFFKREIPHLSADNWPEHKAYLRDYFSEVSGKMDDLERELR